MSEEAPRVWIVLEGPDMSYYGSAEIHGVYASQEEADARCAELNGGTTADYDSIQVEEWGIGEKSNREPPKPSPPVASAPLGAGMAAALLGIYGSSALIPSPQTAEIARRRWSWHRGRFGER